MTPLQALILLELHTHGPMRDVELWQKTQEVSVTPVTMACLALEQDEYIEVPRGHRPLAFEWQLTEKGRQFVITQLQPAKLGGSVGSH
jgi:DNA-binding HxlR family transcriptional regulator